MGEIVVAETVGFAINDDVWCDAWYEVECHCTGTPRSPAHEDPTCVEPYDYRCTELILYNPKTGETLLELRGKMADDTWYAWVGSWQDAKDAEQGMLENAAETAYDKYCDEWEHIHQRRKGSVWR